MSLEDGGVGQEVVVAAAHALRETVAHASDDRADEVLAQRGRRNRRLCCTSASTSTRVDDAGEVGQLFVHVLMVDLQALRSRRVEQGFDLDDVSGVT